MLTKRVSFKRAVRKAIEIGVVNLINEGAEKGLWEFKEKPVEVVPEIKDYTDITVDIGEEKVEKTYEDFLEEKEKAKEARKKKIQEELLKEIEEEEKSDEVDNDSTTEPSATTDISE